MSQKLPMIVKFTVKKAYIEDVKKALLNILEPTRNEAGCLLYELHQDLNDPSIFMFYEVWETVDYWKAHDHQPHIEAFRKIIDGKVKSIEVNQLNILEQK
jgi:quinol monooxygenase YgiN